MTEGFISPHGGYQNLLSYRKAQIVYDATVFFCGRFVDRRSRTHDQMVQAARSGKQNIVEGSMASGTSKETEIKLTNVARASLEELLEDYRDFLRTRAKIFGKRRAGKLSTSASWEKKVLSPMGPMSPMRPMENFWKRGRPRWLPTSSSV